jgi:hypothetical protein
MQIANNAARPGILPADKIPLGLALGERWFGGPVRLMADRFADQLATLERLDASGRARILLEILGRRVRTTTDRRNLMPTG